MQITALCTLPTTTTMQSYYLPRLRGYKEGGTRQERHKGDSIPCVLELYDNLHICGIIAQSPYTR